MGAEGKEIRISNIQEYLQRLQDKRDELEYLEGAEVSEYDYCELQGMKKAYNEVIVDLKQFINEKEKDENNQQRDSIGRAGNSSTSRSIRHSKGDRQEE